MTEDEAMTKICPAIRLCINQTGVLQNGDRPIYEPDLCVASACMAWRVYVRPERYEYADDVEDMPDGPEWAPTSYPGRWARHIAEEKVGHCGLAGRPE
jgi:hypothetical protein